MLHNKAKGSLYILHGPHINSNRRHTALVARKAKSSINITSLDGTVESVERLEIGVLHRSRLVRPPRAMRPRAGSSSAFFCIKRRWVTG